MHSLSSTPIAWRTSRRATSTSIVAVALATNEREVGQLLMESERRATEQRAALDTFLKTARLHVLSTQVSMRLAEGKDARPSMTAVFEHPEGIQSVFVIGTSKVPAWSMPRKVSELTQGLDLLVGIEKSWLRGTVSPKQVNVDDWVIAQFDLADDVSFDVTLRKKLLEKETLAFQLRKTEGVLTGKVVGPDGVPSDLGPDDLGNLDRLWQAVRLGVRDVLDQKEQLLAVSLDGKPIFEQKLVVPLVVRLISMFAPTVREIARRSPNEFELSLKVETDQGRREEVYLRKEQLTSQLQPLSAAGREVFAPLGLDTWVPGTTAAPPEVVPSVVPSPPGSNRTLG